MFFLRILLSASGISEIVQTLNYIQLKDIVVLLDIHFEEDYCHTKDKSLAKSKYVLKTCT